MRGGACCWGRARIGMRYAPGSCSPCTGVRHGLSYDGVRVRCESHETVGRVSHLFLLKILSRVHIQLKIKGRGKANVGHVCVLSAKLVKRFRVPWSLALLSPLSTPFLSPSPALISLSISFATSPLFFQGKKTLCALRTPETESPTPKGF